jgi:hypothetical protein
MKKENLKKKIHKFKCLVKIIKKINILEKYLKIK